MARHSFIQMSKLPNVKGRISYITSHAKQENLYATYRTADNTFWNNLARESQQEFLRSGTTGKGIEARELIIALPEIYTTFDPQQVLEEFTNKFRQQYGVECVSALHHNKRKTNYHIHLIFSERKLLPEPDIKIATRSVFYDETGKRVRTKKEITDENGQVRKGCTVIKKGEVYESHLFTTKEFLQAIIREKDMPPKPVLNMDMDEFRTMQTLMLKVQKQAKAIKKIQEVTLPNLRQQLAETTGIFKGKDRKALEKQIQQTETELAEKLDKIPDILKDDGYPDVQAFMKTYRKAEAIVTQYNQDLAEWEQAVKNGRKPAEKQHRPPERQSVRNRLRQLQEEGKQNAQPKQRKKSQDRDR